MKEVTSYNAGALVRNSVGSGFRSSLLGSNRDGRGDRPQNQQLGPKTEQRRPDPKSVLTIELGFKNEITVRERGRAFLPDATKYGYHIRYDEDYEEEAADYLLKLMSECLPGRPFRKIRVAGKNEQRWSDNNLPFPMNFAVRPR